MFITWTSSLVSLTDKCSTLTNVMSDMLTHSSGLDCLDEARSEEAVSLHPEGVTVTDKKTRLLGTINTLSVL